MLRVTQSNSASRAKSYYSTADYYSEGQELVGQWRGQGARALGLARVIDRADWDEFCDNRNPESGEQLTPRSKSERRVGNDFNFHCPKSVSLLYGITQDERILEAFRDSVRETMEEMEAEAKSRVRKGGRNEDRITGNLTWGEFVHFTARPEDGVPDPHLHAHCFVFNATFDGEERRWKAVQIGDLKRDAPYFEAVFHSRLARRLEELGLPTQRTQTGWELAGIEPETLGNFSRRTARIEKMARERGITDPDAKAELGAQTRSGKAKEMTMCELKEVWRERLSATEGDSLALLGRSIGGRALGENDRLAGDAVHRAVSHCFERASVIPERTLLAEALRQGVGIASRDTVEALVARQELVRATRAGRALVTTKEVLEEEQAMLAFAREGRGQCRPIHPSFSDFPTEKFNDEQRRAVMHVLTARDRVVVVRGGAGTGKTTMMKVARRGIESAGLAVYAFAPSADASRGVLRQAGFKSADTVARLLTDRELQAEVEGQVIWVDEAGLLGTKTMRQLFDLAEREHARIVLSGDRRQHGSVERGAALRLLEEEAGLQPVELREIQRQKDRYMSAVKSLSEGDIEGGFRKLDNLGWVREVADDDKRYAAIADAYMDALHNKKSALVVSPTHAEGDRITGEIRARLQREGFQGREEHVVEQLVPSNLTEGQREDRTRYQPGDVLVFHQNAKGFKRGQRVLVGDTTLPLTQARRFDVFHSRRLAVAAGDRIRITRNGYTLDGKHRLNNGDLYRIRGFTESGDLTLDNDWTVSKDYGHLAYGLVVTSHSSQGKTFQRVIVGQSATSFPASSQEQFYVTASRGEEQVLVFTDSKEELLEAVKRSDVRLSGTEMVAGIDPTRHRVIREQYAALAEHPTPVVRERERELEYDR